MTNELEAQTRQDMLKRMLEIRITEEQIQELSEDLKQERLRWLARFHGLNQDVVNAIRP